MLSWHKEICGVQAMVNVLGVVQTTGAIGSVKRKSDMSELLRRDITLVDQRCCSLSGGECPAGLLHCVKTYARQHGACQE